MALWGEDTQSGLSTLLAVPGGDLCTWASVLPGKHLLLGKRTLATVGTDTTGPGVLTAVQGSWEASVGLDPGMGIESRR